MDFKPFVKAIFRETSAVTYATNSTKQNKKIKPMQRILKTFGVEKMFANMT